MAQPSKRDYRRHVMKQLSAYSDEEVIWASRKIAEKALDDPKILAAKHVLAYVPIAAFAEIDPSYLLSSLGAHAEIDYVASDASARIPDKQYDLILVPVFGYDKDGYRLGHGAGWYDRLLVTQVSAYKVGLALACSYISKLPREPHDIKLDTVLVA